MLHGFLRSDGSCANEKLQDVVHLPHLRKNCNILESLALSAEESTEANQKSLIFANSLAIVLVPLIVKVKKVTLSFLTLVEVIAISSFKNRREIAIARFGCIIKNIFCNWFLR